MTMHDHDLKIWPEHFDAVKNGTKQFEIRLNDRDYKVGDILLLREFKPLIGTYTGREMMKLITYMVRASDRNDAPWERGLQPGYCVLGLSPVL